MTTLNHTHTSPTCLDCGNNKTNHKLAYISSTLTIILERTDKLILGSLLGRIALWMIDTLTPLYFWFIEKIGIIKWSSDTEKALTERSRVIWKEATIRNIPMSQLVIFGKYAEFYRARLPNKKYIYFESIPATKKGFIKSLSWMDDKYTLKKFLAKHHIPTPRGYSVISWKKCEEIFSLLEKPLIVKPRIGSRGRHTTTHIYTLSELQQAFISAKKLCHYVIVEEHLFGSVYRATAVNGKLVGVLEGMPPRITGDGVSTILECITKKNKEEAGSLIKPIVYTQKTDDFLKRLHYTKESILPQGVTIDLSEKIGLSYGGKSRELFHQTNQKVKDILTHSAKCIDAGVIGFDFIIKDPTIWQENNTWGIIECNSLPFINLHHDPLIGEPINVASFIWEAVLEKNTKK